MRILNAKLLVLFLGSLILLNGCDDQNPYSTVPLDDRANFDANKGVSTEAIESTADEATMKKNDVLTQALQKRLAQQEDFLTDVEGIAIYNARNALVLRGIAASEHERGVIGMLAQEISRTSPIVNQLEVAKQDDVKTDDN